MGGSWPVSNAPADFPLTYPGAPPPGDALLYGTALRPLAAMPGAAGAGAWQVQVRRRGQPATLDDILTGLHGAEPVAGRTPVLAVGSNANAAQMRRKLRDLPPRHRILPMAKVRAAGVGAGHSAHVGRWGYVPRTPVARPGWHTHWVIWVDTVQAGVIDATEVNYDVVRGGEPLALAADLAVKVPGWVMYRSKWGALSASPEAGPMLAMTQEGVWRVLMRQPWFAALLPAGADSPARVVTLMARSGPLRDAARDAMAANGWAVDDGLRDAPAAR